MKLKDLALAVNAQLDGPDDVEITAVAGLHEATQGCVTFIAGSQYLKDLVGSRASAAFAPLDTPAVPIPLLRVKNPKLAFAQALTLFYVPPSVPAGISDKAAIGKSVFIGKEPSIHPFVTIADGARIGDRVTLYPGVFVGKGSVVDDDAVIHPQVSIGDRVTVGKRVIIHAGTVLGSDGFGFVTDGGRHHKIPQVGGVIIEDDVEIGGNCTIDRATLGNTLIRKGTKLDNQVHVAHNVTIGEHCLIAGQVGIAGSTTIGNYVVFGGQVGVADHTKVGDRVMAGGKAVIAQDVNAGQVIAGFYAMPIRDWLKVQAVLPRLPEMKKLVADLKKQVQELKSKIADT
jgi:UDP-3-O-[3-hydroxymyristoyl] glucosamine N-acyltransferase